MLVTTMAKLKALPVSKSKAWVDVTRLQRAKKNIAWAWIKSRLNSWTRKGLWLQRYGCLLTFISAKSRFMRLLGRNCLSKATSSRGATFKASLQTVIRSKGRRVIRFLDIWDIVYSFSAFYCLTWVYNLQPHSTPGVRKCRKIIESSHQFCYLWGHQTMLTYGQTLKSHSLFLY